MPPSLASSELIDGQDIETLSPVPASPEPYCSLGVMQPNGDERLNSSNDRRSFRRVVVGPLHDVKRRCIYIIGGDIPVKLLGVKSKGELVGSVC